MAGLIPQSFIDDLLSRADIVDVIDKRVALKKSGKNYSACCPFHNEKSPSFSVQPEKQFYYCFGCGAGGNAIGFIMNFDSVDFPQAVESLARDNGMEVPREESKAATKRRAETADLYTLLEEANSYYQLQLRKHEGRTSAVDYLKKRGVSGAIARDFGIGYAPPGWDNLLKACASTPERENNLLKAGMVIERETGQGSGQSGGSQFKGYDRFRHRIMFPIRDARGRTIAFGGRVLGDDKPKYLNSPETPVFHKGSELYGLFEARKSTKKLSRLLIVEGYMDVIALAQMDIRYAVATLGTATSGAHLTRLFRMVPEVVFCFDGDKAGRTAAWRALEATLPQMEDGRQVRFLFLPEGEDPDTLVRKVGQAAFETLIDNATPLEQFFFDKLSSELDLDSHQGRGKLRELAQPLITQLPEGVFALLMREQLAQRLGIGVDALNALIEKVAATESRTQAPPQSYAYQGADESAGQSEPYASFGDSTVNGYLLQKGASSGGQTGHRSNGQRGWQSSPRLNPAPMIKRAPSSLKAIQLLLGNPEIALDCKSDLAPLMNSSDTTTAVLAKLIEMVHGDPQIDTYALLGYCAGTEFYSELTQLLRQEKITPVEGTGSEFVEIVDRLLQKAEQEQRIARMREELSLKRSELLRNSPQNASLTESAQSASSDANDDGVSTAESDEWARSAPLNEPPPFMDFGDD
jgi:DNA primase